MAPDVLAVTKHLIVIRGALRTPTVDPPEQRVDRFLYPVNTCVRFGVARFEALARFADFLGQFVKFYAHRIGPFQRSLLPFLPRDQFLALVGVRSATLNQRVATGEAAFALGCHKPAHIVEYLVLDAFAMILASMLNCFCGLTLKETANNHGGDDG